MTSMAVTEIERGVVKAASRFFKLVLLVGGRDEDRSAALREYSRSVGVHPLSIGVRLAESLVSSPTRIRPVRAVEEFRCALAERDADAVVLLDHLNVLFLRELQLDPLKLLRDGARNRVVVANWPGVCQGQRLEYAVSGHPEHRGWLAQDCSIVELIQERQG